MDRATYMAKWHPNDEPYFTLAEEEAPMDLANAVVDALAERYSAKLMKNPDWDRKADKAAWDSGQEYPVPEYIERPLEDRRNGECMTVFKDTDGHPSLRALTFTEIGDVVRSVIDESREAD